MNKDEKNKRRWEDVPKSKSLGYPDEMTKRNRYIKKKDKDFMQQLKKSLKEKKSSTDLIGWGYFYTQKQEGH